jgi:hypothetical protein
MTDQHPIPFPPTDKFHQWEDDILNERENVDVVLECVWKDGFQTGADQELDACCEYMQHEDFHGFATELRAARRPHTPPTLKEQALSELDDAVMRGDCITVSDALPTIRRAIEALPND